MRRLQEVFGRLFRSRSTKKVRLPRYQVSYSHPDRFEEVLRSIGKTIERHGVTELTTTERAIWNASEAIAVFSARPENNWGQGHRVENWASAVVGLEQMGLPEVADIAKQTARLKHEQSQLAPDDDPAHDRITELMLVQTRRFAQIEPHADFARRLREFIDRAYQWA